MTSDYNIKISKTIDIALDYLRKEQDADGGFSSYTSGNFKNFKNAKKYSAVFPATLILSCLNELGSDFNAEQIKSKLLKFLLSQKSEQWSFNYWTRNSKEAKKMPYPDDLDDTFCALSAMFKYSPDIFDGTVFAKIAALLTESEVDEGGPYQTWIVPKSADKKWRDVDLAVNNNIAYFLSLQDVFLPKIKKNVDNAIDSGRYFSPYYSSEYSIIYFISRWYSGKKSQKIIEFLLGRQDKNGSWDNPLDTALAVSALLNLGVRSEEILKAIEYILALFQNNSWQPSAFCVESIVGGKKYYAGSSALTTAFCIEALVKYLHMFDAPNEQKAEIDFGDEKSKKIYNDIVKKYRQRFAKHPGDFKKSSYLILDRILSKNKNIALLPYFFRESLDDNIKKINDEFIISLGLANLYGWVAYTIYDDFLDFEGDLNLISVANTCLREMVLILEGLFPKDSNFVIFYRRIIDEIDIANDWEVRNCRADIKNKLLNINTLRVPDYGDYSKLFERSMGHSLGPLAGMFFLGYSVDSQEVKNLISFFKNYIIARQLSDDAHDWERDLEMGILTPAVSLVIKEWQKSNPKIIDGGFVDIEKQLPEFQQIFWRKSIVPICREILKRVKSAEADLDKIKIIKDKSFFKNLLSTPRDSAEKALAERSEALKFLREFSV